MVVFNYGVMNSAKTVNLICKAYELEQKGFKYSCFYPNIDSRTEEGFITSRPGLRIKANEISNDVDLYVDLLKLIGDSYKYILVDEVQFLSEKSIEVLFFMSAKYNLNILCYGLLTDFQTHLFPASKRLVEIADKLHHIESYCDCGNIASVNARIDKEGNIITEGSQIEVGAEDKYITLCKKCYLNK